jgi:hypothetical protein
MSRDLLATRIPKEHTPASPAPIGHPSNRPSASALVEDLLASVKREWSVSKPHAESLWQLAGE